MPLRSPRVPFSQMDLQQSSQYARNVPVVPDDGSTGSEQIKDGAVTEPKLANNAVSTRALALKAVENDRLRDSNALSVMGRSANTNGAPADIALDADGKFLVRRGTQLTGDTIQDSDIPSSIARDTEVTAAIAAHAAASDPHPVYLTQTEGDARYQQSSAKDAASGYAGLNGSSRITKGADTTDDLVIDLATKGLVLKDTQGTPHYWRVTINTSGVLVTTDLGTSKP